MTLARHALVVGLALLLIAPTGAARGLLPDWEQGMRWTFEDENGTRMKVKLQGPQSFTTDYHNQKFDAWKVQSTIQREDSLVISTQFVDNSTFRVFTTQTDVYTDETHVRQYQMYNPPVPKPFWPGMFPSKSENVRSEVRVSRVVDGQPTPAQTYETDFSSHVDRYRSNITVPYGDVEGFGMLTTTGGEDEAYHYSPDIEYWTAVYEDRNATDPKWQLVDAVLTEQPIVRVSSTPRRPMAQETFTLDASASEDPDGEIVRYNWSLPDGSHAEGPSLETTFDEPGRYPIVVTVHDDGGAQAYETVWVRVVERPSELRIEGPDRLDEGEVGRFHALGPSKLVRATWTFGDDSSEATGRDVTHAYLDPGTYDLSVRAVFEDGQRSEASRTIEVRPAGGQGSGSNGSSEDQAARNEGPHLVSPGNGTLVSPGEQSVVVDLGELTSADLALDGEHLVSLSGPGTVIETVELPRASNPMELSLLQGDRTLDSVTLVPEASSERGGSDAGDGGEPTNDSPAPAVLAVLVAGLLAAVQARRRER